MQVSFANQGPEQQLGALLLTLTSDDDGSGGARDDRFARLLVAVNARPEALTLPYPDGTGHLEVHPDLVGLPHVADASASDGERELTLGPRTFCVFVQPQ